MNKLLTFLVVLISCTTFFGIFAVGKKLPSVGYVLVGPSTDGGWSMRHAQGFDSLQKHGYKVTMVESVAEADSEKVFRKLARSHDIVFGTSFGFMEGMVLSLIHI